MCHVDRSEKATWTKQKWRETSESTPRRIYYVLTELYKNQSDKPLLFNRSRVTSPSFGCPLPLVLVRKLGRKLRPVDSTRGIGKPTRTTLRNQMIRSDEKQGNGRLECTGVYPLGPLTMTAPCLHVQESQLSLAVTSLLM